VEYLQVLWLTVQLADPTSSSAPDPIHLKYALNCDTERNLAKQHEARAQGKPGRGDRDTEEGRNTGEIATEESGSVDENGGRRGRLAAALEPILLSSGPESRGKVGSFRRSHGTIKITWGKKNPSRDCREKLRSGQRDGEDRGAETSLRTSQLTARMGERAVFSGKDICLGPSGDGLLMAGIHPQHTVVPRALSFVQLCFFECAQKRSQNGWISCIGTNLFFSIFLVFDF
jgi:hypothetical protein